MEGHPRGWAGWDLWEMPGAKPVQPLELDHRRGGRSWDTASGGGLPAKGRVGVSGHAHPPSPAHSSSALRQHDSENLASDGSTRPAPPDLLGEFYSLQTGFLHVMGSLFPFGFRVSFPWPPPPEADEVSLQVTALMGLGPVSFPALEEEEGAGDGQFPGGPGGSWV